METKETHNSTISENSRNSSSIGNAGELWIASILSRYGVPVAIPYGNSERYDLIAEFDGKLHKIQVKYCGGKPTHNAVTIKACNSNRKVNGHYVRRSYSGEVDYLCAIVAAYDTPIIIPMDVIGERTRIKVRKDKPLVKNPNCHYIDDFTFEAKFGKPLL